MAGERRRARAAALGLHDWIAREVLRAGHDDILRPVRLPRGIIDRALRDVLPDEREFVRATVHRARCAVESVVSNAGPLAMSALELRQLASAARQWPSLAPVVAALQGQAVRNELALLRYDMARDLSVLPPPAAAPASVDAEEIYAKRAKVASNPIARAQLLRWSRVRGVLVWSERAVGALDRGDDATYAVAQAFRARLELVTDVEDALFHKADAPRRVGRQGARERHARERPERDALNATLRAEADAYRARHPGCSDAQAARHLAKTWKLAQRTIRRLIAKKLAT